MIYSSDIRTADDAVSITGAFLCRVPAKNLDVRSNCDRELASDTRVTVQDEVTDG